jgi:4-hydroxy-3-polyprenylbenzoate decarboxylase
VTINYRNLGEFIAALETRGELVRVRTPVSSYLEITEITDRMCKSPGGGKALLFEDVEGSAFPVLTNAFGSANRIALALGDAPDSLADRMKGIIQQSPPRSLRDKLKFIPKALAYSRYLPRTRRFGTPPCQEVVLTGEEVDLNALPILHCWPDDGGRFVTLPVVFTKGLHDGKRNAGMYRMQVYDRNTTGMHWHIHKDGSHHFHEYRKAGKRMEVAVAVGTDPAVTYAASAPMPRGLDEMMLAGFIRQKPVAMQKGVTVDIEVPCEAEFVIEGYVDPEETRIEGPFGDHTGYYSLEDAYPVFHVTAITHRRNPVYSATVVGRPPMEDCYLALATERLFLPMLQTTVPEIRDYWMPWEGVFHNIVVVAIDKLYPGQASKIMSGLWGMGQMSFSKALVIVDRADLLTDGAALLGHILDTMDPATDLTVTQGVLDVLDHSAPRPLFGAKIGLDATDRIGSEGPRNARKSTRHLSEEELIDRLRDRDPGFTNLRMAFAERANPLVLINIRKDDQKNSEHYVEALARDQEVVSAGICVLYDDGVDLDDDSLLSWKAFNNIDPARDLVTTPKGLILDATRKGPEDGHDRPWPEDIFMTEEIRKRVDAKAAEIGLP